MTAPTVKAIVIRSPYAQQIAAGTKRVEYRTWRTLYRGWLAIVAARRRESGNDAGRAVCLVRLVDCVEVGHKDFKWKLADPRPLSRRSPWEIPGRLGLFDVTGQLPAVVLALAVDRPVPTVLVSTPRPPRRVPAIVQFLRPDPPFVLMR